MAKKVKPNGGDYTGLGLAIAAMLFFWLPIIHEAFVIPAIILGVRAQSRANDHTDKEGEILPEAKGLKSLGFWTVLVAALSYVPTVLYFGGIALSMMVALSEV